MLMRMATSPRITVSLDTRDYEILRRISDAQPQSMSSLIAEMVAAMRPGLLRLAEIAEAAKSAKPDLLEAARRSVNGMSEIQTIDGLEMAQESLLDVLRDE